MGGEPNFEAYQRYLDQNPSGPLTVIDGGQPGKRDDYIQLDYNGFRGLDKAATMGLVKRFADAAEGRLGAGSKAELTSTMTGLAERAQKGELLMQGSGGGSSDHENRIVLMDTKTASYSGHQEFLIGSAASRMSATDERLYDQFMREHETAHQILDLKEAGADYVAATRLLQSNPGPETREFLQKMADLRTIGPFRASDGNAGAVMMNYGHGCATAIEAALHAPQDEIKNMPAQEMYENAQTYERINGTGGFVRNDKGVTLRPEMNVRRALLDINPEMASGPYAEAKVGQTAQKLLESDKFQPGTPEHAILEDLKGAAGRMDCILNTPAPAPAPAAAPSFALQPGGA